MAPRRVLRPIALLSLVLLGGCSSPSFYESAPPLLAEEVEGVWLLDLRLTSSSFSCTHWGIILTLAARDSGHLHGTYGYGKGVCSGHGLGPADTLFINPLLTDTTFIAGSRLVIVRNSSLDTLLGTLHPSSQTLTGSAVSRGTLVRDGFSYTIRGTWVARRDPAP